MVDVSEIDARLSLCRDDLERLATDTSAFLTQSVEIEYRPSPVRRGYGEGWIRIRDEVPLDFRVRLTRIIHEARSCLDALACLLAISNGRSDKSVSFPICVDADEFERSGIKQIRKLSDTDQNKIRTVKPYGPGHARLFGMHDYDRIAKHRRLCASFSHSGGLMITQGRLEGLQLVGVPRLRDKWQKWCVIWPGTEFEGRVPSCIRFSEPTQLSGKEIYVETKAFLADVTGIIDCFR